MIVITQTTFQRTLTSLEFFVTSLAINPISIQIMSTMSELDRIQKLLNTMVIEIEGAQGELEDVISALQEIVPKEPEDLEAAIRCLSTAKLHVQNLQDLSKFHQDDINEIIDENETRAEQAYEEHKLNKGLEAARLEYLEDHDWDGSSLNQIPTILEDEGTN